eukprot:TRINITY_DN34035_c0_g1_i1.p1 TRINITY_DN34035_c0_g1~~TRINITY_DN34035_c0_g1_i1.p1  ORF type:complete len:700 (+),score=139.73 TRINITY_DN34035_c0_g1_i1:136-2235(+)
MAATPSPRAAPGGWTPPPTISPRPRGRWLPFAAPTPMPPAHSPRIQSAAGSVLSPSPRRSAPRSSPRRSAPGTAAWHSASPSRSGLLGRGGSPLHGLPHRRQQHMDECRKKVARDRILDSLLREHVRRGRPPSPGPRPSVFDQLKEEMHIRSCTAPRAQTPQRRGTPSVSPRSMSARRAPSPGSAAGYAPSSNPANPLAQLSLRGAASCRSSSVGARPRSPGGALPPELTSNVACGSSLWRCSLRCLAPAFDGAVVWAAGMDGGVAARQSVTGDILCGLPAPGADGDLAEPLHADALHVTEGHLWVGLTSGTVLVYALPSAQLAAREAAHSASVTCFTASAGGEVECVVCSCGRDTSVAVWRAAVGGAVRAPLLLCSGSSAQLRCAALAPASHVGAFAAVWLGLDSGELLVAAPGAWSPRHGDSGGAHAAIPAGEQHGGAVHALAAGGGRIYSAGRDGMLLSWECPPTAGWESAAVGKRHLLPPGTNITALAHDEGAAKLWAGDSSGTVSVWDPSELAPLYALPSLTASPICALAVRHWRRADAVRLWALTAQGVAAWLLARDTDGNGSDTLRSVGAGQVSRLPRVANSLLGPEPGLVTVQIQRRRAGSGSRLGLQFAESTLVVRHVVPFSPAGRSAAAGLVGWRLTHVGDFDVVSPAEAAEALQACPPTVSLRFVPPPRPRLGGPLRRSASVPLHVHC